MCFLIQIKCNFIRQNTDKPSEKSLLLLDLQEKIETIFRKKVMINKREVTYATRITNNQENNLETILDHLIATQRKLQ